MILLPKIAQLYCVTIDDLYKETAVAYDNYAQRLASIYRTTWAPEDFARADREFRKLRRCGTITTEDLRQQGILHQYMMRYCMAKAEELFDEVLLTSPDTHPGTYWQTRRQKLYFLTLIGRGQESIAAQLAKVKSNCEDPNEWLCLIAAYQYTGDYSQAHTWFQKALSQFPDTAMLYVYGGDICKELGRIDEAFRHWDKALELDPELCDAKHSKAFCWQQLGQSENARILWQEIAESQEKAGFDIEAARSRERAAKCGEKLGT